MFNSAAFRNILSHTIFFLFNLHFILSLDQSKSNFLFCYERQHGVILFCDVVCCSTYQVTIKCNSSKHTPHIYSNQTGSFITLQGKCCITWNFTICHENAEICTIPSKIHIPFKIKISIHMTSHMTCLPF